MITSLTGRATQPPHIRELPFPQNLRGRFLQRSLSRTVTLPFLPFTRSSVLGIALPLTTDTRKSKPPNRAQRQRPKQQSNRMPCRCCFVQLSQATETGAGGQLQSARDPRLRTSRDVSLPFQPARARHTRCPQRSSTRHRTPTSIFGHRRQHFLDLRPSSVCRCRSRHGVATAQYTWCCA